MSETTYLKIEKHDNVATNKNPVDWDRYINKSWDKVDEACRVQNKDIEQLKQESFDFKSILPSIKGEGEKVTLNGTSEASFKKFKVEGNSFQKTREGYNILNVPSTLKVSTTSRQYSTPIPANTKITVSWDSFEKGGENNPAIDFRNVSGKTITYIELSENENTHTFTTTDEIASSNIYSNGYNYNNSASVTSTINNLMINIGEAKEYEQYGASPTPQFSSEIENCGDNVNLLNVNDINKAGYFLTSNGVDITFLENGAIKLNGTASKAFSIPVLGAYQSGNYKLNLDGRYALSGLADGCSMSFLNGTNNIAEFKNNEVKDIKQKIDYVILSIKLNASFDNTIIYLKLEKERITSYSKFEQGNINFTVCNKNLINTEILASKECQAIINVTKNGFMIDLSKNFNIKYSEDLFFGELDGNKQYTLSYHIKKDNDVFRPYLSFLYEDGSSEGDVRNDLEYDAKITSNNKKKIIGIRMLWNTQTGGGTAIFSNIMLEEAIVKTDFVEQKKQDFIFPLKRKFYKNDYLADDGIHHKRKEIELDGVTNNLKISNVLQHVNNVYYCTIALSKTAINGCKVYCSHFKNKNQAVEKGNCYITGNGGTLVLVLENQTITTAEQANNWLAEQKTNGTSVVVNYELAVEELEEYSEEQKAIYDEIKKTAKSYKDTTHIFSTDEISCNFDVEAFRDLSSLFTATTVAE